MYKTSIGQFVALELALELEDAVDVVLEVGFAGNYNPHLICDRYKVGFSS